MEPDKSIQFLPKLKHSLFKDMLTGIVDLIYPPVCLVCDKRLEAPAKEICPTCLSNFQLIGKPHEAFSVSGDIFISMAWALFTFDEPFQKLIHQLKYSRRRKPVAVILNHYKSQILSQLPKDEINLVISIPLHPRKFRERGYNQADDISHWLAFNLGARMAKNLVKRTKYTRSQTKLNARERAENVHQAFAVKDVSEIRDSHILLVDDVLTTGATSNSLAEVLHQSGAAQIDLLTLSTPPHGNA